jgi:hypothetical protein
MTLEPLADSEIASILAGKSTRGGGGGAKKTKHDYDDRSYVNYFKLPTHILPPESSGCFVELPEGDEHQGLFLQLPTGKYICRECFCNSKDFAQFETLNG